MIERFLLGYIFIGLLIVSGLTGVRIYGNHDFDFYTDVEQIPDQVAEFEEKYLPFLVSPEEE